jgi:glycosyltransferase involved in cell wall biosynthesis
MKPGITVVIPSIPPRQKMLTRALRSVSAQRRKADVVVTQIDNDKVGAALNRDRGLAQVETEWVAFLDDDDELYSHHLEFLYDHAIETDADLVYPWFDVGSGGTDPFPQFEGRPWSNENPHQIPITFLVKTEVAKEIGGFSGGWNDTGATDDLGNRAGEDWHFTMKLVEAGHKIVHLNERTWIWHHHASNTSGLPSRW